MLPVVAQSFLTNVDFLRGSRQAVAVHMIGYTLRQKVYEEMLNGGQILKDIQTFNWHNVPLDIWYMSIVPTVIFLALKDRGLSGRRSMEKLTEFYASSSESYKTTQALIQFMVLAFLIIFTKDVGSAT